MLAFAESEVLAVELETDVGDQGRRIVGQEPDDITIGVHSHTHASPNEAHIILGRLPQYARPKLSRITIPAIRQLVSTFHPDTSNQHIFQAQKEQTD